MKLSSNLTIATVATAILSSIVPLLSTHAVDVSETDVPDDQIAVIAVPAGSIGYNLAVIEQIPGQQQCWSESGSQPTIIEPLWTTFDFTGSCNRATDSNGYSVRVDGQDTSLDYLLSVVSKGDTLELVAQNRSDRSRTTIGTTFGEQEGEYHKIYLNPGWEITKKTIDDKVLGHYYLSGDTAAIAAAGDAAPTSPTTVATSFRDTGGDIYANEIEQAVALGFIAGFEDNTFRPEEPLTREQLVSMVFGALDTIDNLEVRAPNQVTARPYPDVDTSRWSAAKIEWAKDNEIVTGYPDGSFRPEQPVTRAELMAILQNAAKFAKLQEGLDSELVANQEVANFTDIAGHWGQDLIQQMSAYCNVASAYNETGNSFNPDTPSGRNYAAAATLRMHECAIDEFDKAKLDPEL